MVTVAAAGFKGPCKDFHLSKNVDEGPTGICHLFTNLDTAPGPNQVIVEIQTGRGFPYDGKSWIQQYFNLHGGVQTQ